VAEKPDQQDALFVNLVLIFQNAAMQQMGKISNPVSGEMERNLEQARFSIDMIDMLKAKTQGNLSADLEKLLDTTLTNLRMNYVDEVNKEGSKVGEGRVEGRPSEEKPKEGAGAPEEEPGSGDKEPGVGGAPAGTPDDGETGTRKRGPAGEPADETVKEPGSSEEAGGKEA